MNNGKARILITGANGFVGSRLCQRFIDKGFDVIAGVRKSADLSNLADMPVTYRHGDVTDAQSLPAMVKAVDYIIHNAGIVKAKKNEQFFRVNEFGTKSLVEAVIEHNPEIKKLIYISSLAAYGPSERNIPRKETDTPCPVTTYGRSKLAGEKQVLSFKEQLHVLSLRPAGVYGPGDKEIFSFFETIHKRIKPYIGNLSRKIQLVHVDDLCLAVYKAVQADTVSGSAYFIAENQAYQMKELIALLEDAVGKKGFPLVIPGFLFKIIAAFSKGIFKIINATPMLTPEKANELLASWEISTAAAKKDLRFESQIPFPEGARKTYAWYIEKGWLK